MTNNVNADSPTTVPNQNIGTPPLLHPKQETHDLTGEWMIAREIHEKAVSAYFNQVAAEMPMKRHELSEFLKKIRNSRVADDMPMMKIRNK